MATPQSHRIFVVQHSMNSESLAVYCTCGDLYADPHYLTLMDDGTNREPSWEDAKNPNYGVPLSVLMDIAEEHQNDVEGR